MSNKVTFISLFTGIGGFDLGFENTGMECIGQCEIDKYANMVLRRRWPDTERMDDVRKITRTAFPVPDLICGGFPCQDLSVAGKRAGLAGNRSGLFFEFERIVSEFKPPWFVIENVPGLLSSNKKRDFATVLQRLGECGYLQAYRVLDSQYFGVAQRRRRVFIVGSLGNGGCAQVLFESESLPGNPAEGRKKGERVAGAITNSAHGGGFNGQDAAQDRLIFNNTRDEVRKMSGDGQLAGALAAEPGMKQQNYVCYENHAQDSRIRQHGDKSPTLHKKMGTGGNNIPLVQDVKAITSKGNGECWESDTHTILSSSGGGQAGQGYPAVRQGFGVRCLTPKECERLQGFPDDWTRWGIDESGNEVEISNTQRYKMCGNAVTVSVVEWIGGRIFEHR